MPKGLRRIHGGGDFHFITCSCYRRLQFLGSARRRDLFLKILEEVRQKYNFIVVGYVVMPEHFHILVSEPKTGTLSLAMQVLKQRVARKCREKRRSTNQLRLWEAESAPAFWQTRYYDFNVYSGKKKIEKLRYMHRNPVKRGSVDRPEQWKWSSFRAYFYGETGPVRMKFQEWALEIKRRPVQSFGEVESPLIRKVRE
jgi:putative transposase